MRTALALFLLGASPLLLANGCTTHDDCASRATCAVPAASTPSDGGGVEADAGPKVYAPVPPPAGCVVADDPASSPLCVDDTYALFVDGAKGRDENPGTKGAPLKTLNAALDIDRLAGRRRIYLTDAPQPGNFVLPPGVSLAGGFRSSDWGRPVGQTTKIEGAIGNVPTVSVVESSDDIVLSDLVISAPATGYDESSLGMFLASKSASLYRLDIRTGTAGNGSRKQLQSNRRKEVGAGTSASPNPNLCTCPLHGTTTGGGGGLTGQAGSAGSSSPQAASIGTRTSEGGLASCTDGHSGGDGVGGAGGASAPVVATIDATGWHPSNGEDGKPGEPGSGGGGGGNGGGSGGCGGCGGAGGRGGSAGGSSIGIVAYHCAITLVASTIVTGTAGQGADGDKGESGELGGEGGISTCNGGRGGTGGGGGGGSGGAAGISAAIARNGGAVQFGGDSTLAQGMSGIQGGRGDQGDAANSPAFGLGQPGRPGAPGAAAPKNEPVVVLE